MNFNEGDQVEIRVASGGHKVVEVVRKTDSIEDRTAGFLYEEVYGSERGRAFNEDVARVLE